MPMSSGTQWVQSPFEITNENRFSNIYVHVIFQYFQLFSKKKILDYES